MEKDKILNHHVMVNVKPGHLFVFECIGGDPGGLPPLFIYSRQ